ncbi:toll/interleukin-1 receptor domain-containing protein [Paenibacillus wynnii]|uniref:toll/interleukin-1 receptor domain-containing protein n=1 Tax=Paenibacillus wynnii TaxID=268407 RepID=UPI00279165B8|nr:toll/interleukin-1 receptor domain-containing protein [Paenibacillus wynnii]MDQ0195831.1 hypothetical protein [Paenibacillus wynnii]
MTKIFISHKKEDSEQAGNIAYQLRRSGVDVYLDVLDPRLQDSGEELSKYLQGRLNQCTHLLAVLSYSTRLSWWVPFEIGIATEKQYPISSYLTSGTRNDMPEYLWKWPVLRSAEDLQKYITLLTKPSSTLLNEEKKHWEFSAKGTPQNYADAFHRRLKINLGQP